MAKTKRYPGSIEKRGESYRIRLCVGNTRHYFTLTTKDRKVAEAFARSKEAELREEAARQAAGLPGALTCTQLLQRFEELHLPKKSTQYAGELSGRFEAVGALFRKGAP